MERDELAAWLRLALTPGVGNGTARRLLTAFGLPEAVFCQSESALSQLLTSAQTQSLRLEPDGFPSLLDVTWQWLNDELAPQPRHILTLADSAYPAGLLQTADPPLMLYLIGSLPTSWPNAVAVVGSRNPTPQGLVNARQFSRSFAQAGLTVVSGLALGIDAAAHEGAIDGAAPHDLATIAVVGTGLDRVYPRQHHDLAHRVAQHGLLVSEYRLGTPPLAPNFPKRNRIISALSLGTVVVEAALKSGSLITAQQATEQGKEVFAIPGSIHSTQSRGCHALLKQGAKLVESAQDVLEELPLPDRQQRSTGEANDKPAPCVGDEPPGLLSQMGYDPVSLDALVARTGIGAADLQAQLLELELAGDVARLPGGLFQRLGAA
jgi:DNA processing protein